MPSCARYRPRGRRAESKSQPISSSPMTLPKTSLGLAVGVLLAAAVGGAMGGARGMGLFLGFFLGATLAGLAVAWQAHCLRFRPERVTRAQMEGFAIKFAAVALFALAFRFVEPLAQVASWQTFLLAYAAATVLVLPLSALDLSRLMAQLRERSAPLEARRSV